MIYFKFTVKREIKIISSYISCKHFIFGTFVNFIKTNILPFRNIFKTIRLRIFHVRALQYVILESYLFFRSANFGIRLSTYLKFFITATMYSVYYIK